MPQNMVIGWNKWALAFLILFYGCAKKEHVLTISGKVLEKATALPIANVSITLYANGVVQGVYQSNMIYIAGSTTSSDGSFKIQIPEDKYDNFQLRFYKNDFFNEKYVFSLNDFNHGKVEHLQWMQAILPVYLHVKNLVPYDDSDKLVLVVEELYDCQECCGKTSYQFLGTHVDSTVYCLSVKRLPLIIHKYIQKNNQPFILVDTIKSTNVDTLKLFIDY